jgi:hypothetical protein
MDESKMSDKIILQCQMKGGTKILKVVFYGDR